MQVGGGNTSVVIHYDINAAYPQPLIDVASGFCLELVTASDVGGTALFERPDGLQQSTQAPLTAAQLSALGFTTRADIAGLSAQ